MKPVEITMRFTNEHPVGLKLTIDLSKTEFQAVAKCITPLEGRLGITSDASSCTISIAPGMGGGTVSHLMLTAQKFANKVKFSAPGIGNEMSELFKQIQQYGNDHPLQLGKTGHETNYKQKVDEQLKTFSQDMVKELKGKENDSVSSPTPNTSSRL